MDEQYIEWAEFLMAEEARESYYRAIAEELAQLPKDPVDWSIATACDEWAYRK